jgi:hypothetical protein
VLEREWVGTGALGRCAQPPKNAAETARRFEYVDGRAKSASSVPYPNLRRLHPRP